MIVNGARIAQEIYQELGDSLRGKKICFVSFLESPESRAFIERKQQVAEKLGLTAEIKQEKVKDNDEALQVIDRVVAEGYDGIVVQLPLPKNLDAQTLFDRVPIALDIDLLSTGAKESYIHHRSERVPPVAGAVQEILKHQGVNLAGRQVVLLGKGRLVGEPVSLMLWKNEANFSNFDINTPEEELFSGLKKADIIITGIGNPHFIKPDMIKPGAVLIDAGTSEQKGVLAGDVDPDCAEKASLYTPVPGGVGPVTVAVLMRNLCHLS